ncbi:hypothetical protein BGZ96_006696, partial [Linnemannia gamsii]
MRRCCNYDIGVPDPQVHPASQGLSTEELVLDIVSVEEHKRGCKDLQELRVQFRGLEDTQAMCEYVRFVCLKRQGGAFSSV